MLREAMNSMPGNLGDSLWESRAAISKHLPAAALITLIMAGIVAGHLVELSPAFAPALGSPAFRLFNETSEMFALMVSLYAAHRWHHALGMWGMVFFVAVLSSYYMVNFSERFTDLVRLLFIALIALFGILLIVRQQQATEVIGRRQREIKALAEMNAKILNERVQLLEKASRGGAATGMASRSDTSGKQ